MKDLQNKAQWLDEIFFQKKQSINWDFFEHHLGCLLFLLGDLDISSLSVAQSIPRIVIFVAPHTCVFSSVHYSNLTSEGEMRVDLESLVTLLKGSVQTSKEFTVELQPN